MDKKKLDFIIVGSMKAGTSSLSFHLLNHKHVCIPKKEMHFFDNNQKYLKGREWYLKKIYKNYTDSTKITGEKTPTYSYQENVAERIHKNFPDIKLVWMFRNPIDRAYSNYLHSFKEGFDLLSFKEAIDQEPQRAKKNIFHGYLERSKYFIQVERFLKFYPKESMHFMIFENFIANPDEELKKLFNFLGISSEGFKFVNEPRNKTIIPWSPRLQYLYRQAFGKNLGFELLKKLNRFMKKPGYVKLDSETRKSLIQYFDEHNLKLEKLLNKNLDIWKE